VPGKSVTVAVPGLKLPLDVYAYDGMAGLEPDQRPLVPRPRRGGCQLLFPGLNWPEGGRPPHCQSQRQASHRADRRRGVHPHPPPTLFTSWQTLGRAAASLTVNSYDVDLKPGTSTGGYIAAFGRTLGASYIVDLVLLALAGLAIAATAALGPATWAAASKTTTTLHAE